MILKPFNPAVEALELAGVLSAAKKDKEASQNIKEMLEANGASLSAAARALGDVLSFGEHGEKIRATQLVFQAHGILKEADKPSLPSININIIGKESNNKPLIQLMTPAADFYKPEETPDNLEEAQEILNKA